MKADNSPAEAIGQDYDAIYVPDSSAAQREVEFILNVTHLRPGASILDLCCGTGRHSIELAKRGFEVFGLDLSEAFLKIAKDKAASEAVNPTWLSGDMRVIPFENKLDLILNLNGSWGYFDDEENFRVFAGVAKALKAGGHFFFNFFNHDWIMRNFQPLAWWQAGNSEMYCMEKREFDILEGRHISHVIAINKNAEIKEWTISVRGYTFVEIKQMLERAGLQVLESYGDFQGRPFSVNTPQLILLTTKPKSMRK